MLVNDSDERESLEARLHAALRSAAESEAARMQAEQRARLAEQRLVRRKLAIARPTMRLDDSEGSNTRAWPSQRTLWIGLACSVLCLFAAAAYSTVYVPLQRRLAAQQTLHRRSVEQHERELAAIQSLLQQEQARSLLERNRLSARISELVARRSPSPPQPERPASLPTASFSEPDSPPTSLDSRKRIRRHQQQATRAPRPTRPTRPNSDPAANRPSERPIDTIGDLQLR